MPAGSATLAMSYESLGGALVAQHNLSEALQSYRTGLDIRERLAKTDPSNAGWQRDLAVTHMKVAAAYQKENQPLEAREAFNVARGIEAGLVEAHPDVAQFKHDLDWVDQQIAALIPVNTNN